MLLAHALAAATLVVSPSAPPAQLIAQLPACSSDQLTYLFDGEDGAFDGMSHSGALLVVRNVGPQACRLGALPQLRFEDAAGHALAVARSAPVGMHPGPVVLPVALAPGAEATAPLRWVSGDVYGGGDCVSPVKVEIDGDGGASFAALRAHMCGPAGKPVGYQQPLLRTDPMLTPAR